MCGVVSEILDYESDRVRRFIHRFPHLKHAVRAFGSGFTHGVPERGYRVAQHHAHVRREISDVRPGKAEGVGANLEFLDCIQNCWRVYFA